MMTLTNKMKLTTLRKDQIVTASRNLIRH
ncbi:unnamed protein product [Acanthoscelides obtectus]|uniref:Uncharacterized protein n=1 Tax=Acanthoscelides obtectus TaxID=200917 RepID=A0A9P0MCN3_ACAOB|nr:unnamed protein product [Acanthoscelides obtectus]CAK1634556.1 hypothetical protein AOBTE_LOCUS8805 [Acanthoscelides obtectus]